MLRRECVSPSRGRCRLWIQNSLVETGRSAAVLVPANKLCAVQILRIRSWYWDHLRGDAFLNHLENSTDRNWLLDLSKLTALHSFPLPYFLFMLGSHFHFTSYFVSYFALYEPVLISQIGGKRKISIFVFLLVLKYWSLGICERLPKPSYEVLHYLNCGFSFCCFVWVTKNKHFSYFWWLFLK